MTRRPRLAVAVLLALALAAGAGCQRAPAPPQVDIHAHPGELALADAQAAAAQGDPVAQRLLGQRYLGGDGVTRDPRLAAYWWRKAAEQQDAEAQSGLAALYFTGQGVAQDRARAMLWWHQAARNGDGDAQAALGWVYFQGIGTPRDEVLAFAWSLLAADNGIERARANRDAIARLLSPAQLARGRRLAAGWAQDFRDTSRPRRLQKVGEGTVFLVNLDGGALTAHHVVADCAQLRLRGRGGSASVLAVDVEHDLALLRVPGSVDAIATFASDPGSLSQGDAVLVFGYPLTAWLSIGGNLTPGIVSATSGLGNDPNQMQITAPIQPGSSGSPVLDQRGMVVGLVSMRLSDARMVEATGTSGQNLNFAVSGLRLNQFLRRHGAAFQASTMFDLRRDNADIAEQARRFTGVIECWK